MGLNWKTMLIVLVTMAVFVAAATAARRGSRGKPAKLPRRGNGWGPALPKYNPRGSGMRGERGEGDMPRFSLPKLNLPGLGMRGERDEGDRRPGQHYTWEQPLTGQGKVTTRAFVPEGKTVVHVTIKGNLQARVLPSRSLYDFSVPGGSPGSAAAKVVMTRLGRNPICFKRNTALTLAEMVQLASGFNETGNPAAHTQVSVDGTGQVISGAALSELFRLHPEVKSFCKNARVVDLVSSAFEGPSAGIAKTVTFNEELAVRLPQRSGRRRPN